MINSTNSTNTTSPYNGTYDEWAALPGEVVPRTFRPGFVVLSYFVSYVGAWTTLELLHRRTSIRGLYNWFLLVSSSITMGGIAVWSMHFIGNRALVLGNGEAPFQIVYSPSFTIISFFIPVAVVFIAFATVGTPSHTFSITRLSLGGTLAGFGICGMHYLGQAGISNYDCFYNAPCVVGAAIIAILASVGALVIFFITRSAWRTAWWKRACCAILLATAVSGMHWIASVGTTYRLRMIDPRFSGMLSRSSMVIIVLVLSIFACLILLFFMMIAQRRIIMLAKRAQQVVLAVAVFDLDGRILVSAEGLLPTRKITNAWLEQSLNDVFNNSHPVFLWMFRTSRHWLGVAHLLPSMRNHTHQIGLRGILGSKDGQLLKESGDPIEHYTLVFRELFCIAAADLAASMGQSLENVGVLYDEMVATGRGADEKETQSKKALSTRTRKSEATTVSAEDLELESFGVSGKGQLFFLTRGAGRREVESYEAAGYRFANIPQVISIISNSLQVKPGPLSRRFDVMREYAADSHLLDIGVHVALFAIRASLGAGRHGFDILARKDAKNQLPTMQLQTEALEDWQWDYIKSMDTFPLAVCMKTINTSTKASNPSKKEQAFAKLLLTCLETIKTEIEDPFINDALLIGQCIDVPCRSETPGGPPGKAQLICFTIIVPIHGRAPGKKLLFEPLNFFTMQQHVYPESPDHEAFAKRTHREYKAVLNLGKEGSHGEVDSFHSFYNMSPYSSRFTRNKSGRQGSSDEERPQMTKRKTRIRFWDRSASNSPSEAKTAAMAAANGDLFAPSLNPQTRDTSGTAGLLVPTSPMSPLTVPVTPVKKNAEPKKSAEEEEKDQRTYVDDLFVLTIQKKGAVR